MTIVIVILLGIIALAVAPELTLLIFVGIPLLCVVGLILLALLQALPAILAAVPTLLLGVAFIAAVIGIVMGIPILIATALSRNWRKHVDQTWESGGREKLARYIRGRTTDHLRAESLKSNWPRWREAAVAELERRRLKAAANRAAWAALWAR